MTTNIPFDDDRYLNFPDENYERFNSKNNFVGKYGCVSVFEEEAQIFFNWHESDILNGLIKP